MANIATPRWAWMAAAALAIVVLFAVVFRLGAQASAGVAIDDSVVWVEHGGRGEVLQVNPHTREVTARITVGERGDSIMAIPAGRDAVFLNRTTGELGVIGAVSQAVDSLVTLEPPSGPVIGEDLQLVGDLEASGQLFILDEDRVIITDSDGPAQSVSAPTGLGSTVVAADGRLLTVLGSADQVSVTSSVGLVPFASLPGLVDGSDQSPQLARSGDDLFVVDSDRRTVTALLEDGSLGISTCIAGSLTDVAVAGANLSDPGGRQRVLVHDPAAKVLSVSEPARSECFDIDIDTDGELYGPPVALDGVGYLPNFDTGRIVIVDLIDRSVVDVVRFAVAGRPFELEVFGSTVIANEPTSTLAAFVSRDGITPFSKVDRVLISSGSDDGTGDGASAIVDSDEAGEGRFFGETGDETFGGGSGADGDVAGGGDTPGTGGDAPSSGDDLDPGTDQSDAPLEVFVDQIDRVVEPEPDELVANFEFSADTVNVGEEASFVDASTGNPVSWNWDFGDGTGADGPEATKVWDQDGIYTVTLFVADAQGNQQQASIPITVVAVDVQRPPVANFTFDSQTVETGQRIEFRSQATGEPDTLLWNLGDGAQASGEIVEHRYAVAGTYIVTLTATNEAGSDTKSGTITVVDAVKQPEAIIGPFNKVIETGQSVTMRSESTNSPTDFSWDFGDGSSSTGREVRHSWREPDTYRVRLTVSNSAGSSSTVVDVVVNPRVDPPVARFNQSTFSIVVGEEINFNDLSLNDPTSFTWEFGDGKTATGKNVSHAWDEDGTYSVTLTVENEAGTDEATKTITILPLPPDPPTASFTVSSATVPVNTVVSFTDTSTGDPSSWSWDFGDGSSSTAQDPPHAFSAPGQYEVTLTASNAGGSTTSTQTVLVSDPPVAQFDVAADELDVSFTDLSSNGPTTWSWDFGDGTTSTSQSPTHEYESAGTYLVTLVASNTVGESAPSEVSITVARRPRARFDYEENGLSVTFEDRSTREPTSWLWDFGDGTTSTSQNPTHIYEDRGRYDVVLTVANVAGTDDTDRTIRVQERPPEAKFSCGIVGSSVACDGSDSTNVVQWQWFSDEAIVIANGDTPTPVFTYLRSGVYEITLVVTNSSEDTDSLTKDSPFVEVPEPPTIQTLDVVSNVDGLVELSASASQSPTGWSWTAPGATFVSGQNSDSPVLRYNSEGQKTVTAIASNGIGDSDPVQLGFSINLILPPVITNVNVQPGLPGRFTVSATATNSPDSWSWNMPGAAISGGNGPNPTFTFNANGIYNGSVVASNEDGSSAPFPITITVNNLPEPPVVTSVVEQSNAGGVVTMLAVATNNPTGWQWQMTGDINTQGENTASATFTFDANGTYGGRVRAANGAGIGPWNNFQVTVNDIVVVPPPPTAGFTWGQVSQVPPRVDFTDASSGDGPLTYTWDFGGGTGDTAASSPTGVTFPAAGSYTVTLTVTDGFAQSDSTSSIVDVTEPPPDPDALPPAPDQDPPVP